MSVPGEVWVGGMVSARVEGPGMGNLGGPGGVGEMGERWERAGLLLSIFMGS